MARVHSPGDGLEYKSGPEHRDADELAELVKQLPGKLVYFKHPSTFPAISSGQKSIGVIMSARMDDGHAVAQVAITDPATINALRAGIRELSLGYTCDLDENKYQRNTHVDHLAIVPVARCGSTCALRTDERKDCDCQENTDMDETTDALPGSDVFPGSAIVTTPDNPLTTGTQIDPPQCASCGGPLACVACVDGVATGAMKNDAKLTANERNDVPATEFAVPSTRQLPIENAGHVRAAMSRFGQTHFADASEKSAAYHRILALAKALGVDDSGFRKAWSGRLDSTDLTHANPMPSSDRHVVSPKEPTVNLEAAMAALAAANEKLGALTAQHTVALAAEKTRADGAEQKLTAAEVARDLALAEKTALTVAADKARTDAASQADADKTRFDAAVAERVEILAAANAVLGDKDKDGNVIDRSKDDARVLKVQIIKHVDGVDIADDKAPAYVDGMFANVLARHAKASTSTGATRAAIVEMRRDGVKAAAILPHKAQEELAAKALKARMRAAWTSDIVGDDTTKDAE